MIWTVDNPNWPARRHDDELTTEQILDVLDLIGRPSSAGGTKTSNEEQANG